jgi:hypothetical protein
VSVTLTPTPTLDMELPVADINGKSFIATLASTTDGVIYPVGYLDDSSLAGDGWLIQAERDQPKAAFRFDFIEESGTRLLYTLSAAEGTPYAGARVGVSRNGYLGFYSRAAVTEPWKIELGDDPLVPDTFNFLLRDSRGYRVGSVKESKGGFWTGLTPADRSRSIRYLNVEEGDVVYFQGAVLDYL